jgi:hypothetical protein
MISLVEEIIQLGVVDENLAKLNLCYVDLNILCQHIINSLQVINLEKHIELSFNLSDRLYLLDKEKAGQAIYHLLRSILEIFDTKDKLFLEVYEENTTLDLAINVFQPCHYLAEPGELFTLNKANQFQELPLKNELLKSINKFQEARELVTNGSQKNGSRRNKRSQQKNKINHEQESNYQAQLLRLLFSCQLAEIQGGMLVFRPLPSNHKYILKLPKKLPS